MAATVGLSSTEEYKGYAKDIGIVACAYIVSSLLQFAQLSILTKWLGASLYGTWSLIWVTIVLITPLATLELGMALVRFLAAEKDAAKIRERFLSVLFITLIAGVVISLLLLLCSDLFATSIIGDANSASLVRLGSLMVITQALSQMSIAFFRTFRQMKWYSALIVIKAAVQLGLMLCLLLLDWEMTGVIIAVLASDILSIAIALSVALRQTGFQLPRFTEMKGYLKYGLPLIPTSAMLWILSASDRYMIGYFMKAEDVGIYTAAYTLTYTLSLFLSPLQAVLLPTVSKSYDGGDIDKTRAYFKYSLKYLLMLTIPTTFGISVLASPLLSIFTTSEFVSGYLVTPFIAFGLLIFEFHQIYHNILYLVKKTYWVLRLLVISTVLNIGLNLLLIPHLGIVGAAVATLIAYVVLGVLTVVITLRYFKFDIEFSFIVKSVLASAVMATVLWLFEPSGIIEVIIAVLLGIIIYFAMLLVLKGFGKNEIALFKSLISGRYRPL